MGKNTLFQLLRESSVVQLRNACLILKGGSIESTRVSLSPNAIMLMKHHRYNLCSFVFMKLHFEKRASICIATHCHIYFHGSIGSFCLLPKITFSISQFNDFLRVIIFYRTNLRQFSNICSFFPN